MTRPVHNGEMAAAHMKHPNESTRPETRRVVVLGTSGAGKSTVARTIAELISAEHVELDGLHHGPNWTPRPVEDFVGKVEELAGGPRWVVDGNYFDRVGARLWPRADLIVWLDLPLYVTIPRIIRRTVLRIIHRTELWNGNREQWSALMGRESLLVWAVKSQRRHRRELPGRLAALTALGIRVVRLRSSAAANRWIAELPRSGT